MVSTRPLVPELNVCFADSKFFTKRFVSMHFLRTKDQRTPDASGPKDLHSTCAKASAENLNILKPHPMRGYISHPLFLVFFVLAVIAFKEVDLTITFE